MTENTGKPHPGRVPERQCVSCRALKPRTELVRVVREKDGTVALDPTHRRHGRGAYACQTASCLERATRKGGFARALRQRIPQELISEVLALGQQTPGIKHTKGTSTSPTVSTTPGN